jgi:hypothetical protein
MTGRTLQAAVAVGIVAGLTMGCGRTTDVVSGTPALPLASGVSTPSQSSVSVAMGHLDDPDNTFWELFLRPTGSSSWSLRTPPGVADNGGLAVDVPPAGPVTAGILPSDLLRFSPLARTTDGGKTWLPGELPAGLVAGPDVLAGSSIGPTAALVNGSGQTVLSGINLSGWHPLVTTKALTETVKGCGVRRITAVAEDGNDPILGVQCTQEGRIGVLFPRSHTPASSGDSSTTWVSGGPLLPGASPGVATVLRLERATPAAGSGTVGGLNGLAMVQSDGSSSLVAFWSPASDSSWTQSSRLTLPATWAVGATATGGGSNGRGIAVVLDSGTRRRIVSVAGPGDRWVTSPVPPAGTDAAVVVGSQLEAFVVANSHLAVWASGPTGGWRLIQKITVSVPYGSSS